MKEIICTIVFASILLACSKNEIEIQKMTDTSWEIDKKIQENDIRTRLGYDPRKQQVYFYEAEGELPMYSLSTLDISGRNKFDVLLNFTNKIEKDIKISLVYDATLYESLKEKYPDYELGNQELVTLPSEITATQGNTSANIEIFAENKTNFNKKVILPFSLKLTEEVHILKGSETFVLKVVPKEIELKNKDPFISKVIEIDAVTDNISVIDGNKVDVRIAATKAISQDISLGLIRDESYTGQVAPIGVEGVIEKVPFKNITEATLSFQLQDVSQIRKGRVVLPLKLVIYDANGNVYPTNLNLKVYLTPRISYPKDNVEGSNITNMLSGAKISNVSGRFDNFFNEGNRGNFDKMLDGDESTFAYFSNDKLFFGDEVLVFTFAEKKRVKTIRLKIDETTPTDKIIINIGDEVVGTANFSSTSNWYVITFKKAFPLDKVYLHGFSRDGKLGNFNIYEAEFYEE